MCSPASLDTAYVERDHLILVHQAACERRRDEPRATGDEDALSLQSHVGDSSLRGCREISTRGSIPPPAATRSSSTGCGGSSCVASRSPRAANVHLQSSATAHCHAPDCCASSSRARSSLPSPCST